MTWRVSKISGTLIGSTWRVARALGTLGATWRVAKISGTVSNAPLSTWRIAKISGVPQGNVWRVAKISGAAAGTTAPTLQAFPDRTVDPILPVTVVAVVTNGITPDSYSFTSPGVTLTVNGNQATFVPPGTTTGGTVAVTVTATKGANTSSPQVSNFIVNPSYAYSGAAHPMSAPYYSS